MEKRKWVELYREGCRRDEKGVREARLIAWIIAFYKLKKSGRGEKLNIL